MCILWKPSSLFLSFNAAGWTAGEKERNRPASLSYSVTWHKLVLSDNVLF